MSLMRRFEPEPAFAVGCKRWLGGKFEAAAGPGRDLDGPADGAVTGFVEAVHFLDRVFLSSLVPPDYANGLPLWGVNGIGTPPAIRCDQAARNVTFKRRESMDDVARADVFRSC